ncbi:hypothetical protein FNF31_07171 [Cafeteria roenbergensis]|uniref:Uncharacterized protein n=1 Tax=Cafeteria roenbergensis TaxID=33653 RepID=A0A5A8C974_CAFRO|nr:hypothetical protein FNF31_07171 [Cafeteria roenbergensis]
MGCCASTQASPPDGDAVFRSEGRAEAAKRSHAFMRDNGWPVENSGACLHRAVAEGRTPVVATLLGEGADASAMDDAGWTVLTSAAFRGHTEVVGLLLEHGAALEAANGRGWTPLLAAAHGGRPDVARLLLDRGAAAEVVGADDSTPLIVAARRGHTSVVRVLLEHGAAMEARNQAGMTALIAASLKGRATVVRLLLLQGADALATDDEGQSAWDRASSVRCREALAHTEPLQRWHRRRQLALWAPQREAWEDDGGASLDGASPLAASQHVHWEFDV